MRVRHLTKSLSRWASSNGRPHNPQKGDKVVVGMSGGVDSSVTAALLAEKDFDLSAVFMRNWDTRDETGQDRGCEWEKDWEDVQRVCRKLDIPCQLVSLFSPSHKPALDSFFDQIDLTKEFWNNVFQPALHLWETGATPNPDVWCNREIKFGALLNQLPVTSSGETWLATGHYARKMWADTSEGLSRPQLFCAVNSHKDQSYYLSSISESSLRRTIFPLGYLEKPEVRELAKKYELHNADRDESMGICFVGQKSRFNQFLGSYLPPKPGPIVNKTTGKVVAQHNGIWSYTIGEGARLAGAPERLFVSGKDPATNTIYVVPGTHNPMLNCHSLHVPKFHWIWKDSPPPEIDSADGFRAFVRHRYRMASEVCRVYRLPDSGHIRIDFDKAGKSASPGQVAAVYDGSWCLGCGIIERTS
ncbi:hypothetical protein D9756_001214 [Leucocoprinus leucothites]|uniref:tRNA-5-taurinomethyluridine 2-sulfurtransferase n=1 Tax=Leucocoprinus leucothites TaxID=201217 RepID=A0A8H5G4T0_9AGAR|nr:hypothetical protein D9756_001214 [Leucoagaricus leucothites]